MTRVRCGWSLCRYNSAIYPKEIGICIKDEITIKYSSIEILEDEECDILECEEYAVCLKKFC